jgi:hypothetical protein
LEERKFRHDPPLMGRTKPNTRLGSSRLLRAACCPNLNLTLILSSDGRSYFALPRHGICSTGDRSQPMTSFSNIGEIRGAAQFVAHEFFGDPLFRLTKTTRPYFIKSRTLFFTCRRLPEPPSDARAQIKDLHKWVV